MLYLSFETVDQDTFCHIVSTTGVLGHAAEVKSKVPSGTWLTIPESLRRLTPWMVQKCGFRHLATVIHEGVVMDILKKE